MRLQTFEWKPHGYGWVVVDGHTVRLRHPQAWSAFLNDMPVRWADDQATAEADRIGTGIKDALSVTGQPQVDMGQWPAYSISSGSVEARCAI